MIDHLVLPVKDLEKSTAFYTAALAPLGYAPGLSVPGSYQAFQVDGDLEFWITLSEAEKITPVHVAFRTSQDQVESFYQAALEAGGSDNGAPGVRSDYHPRYYGAFVLDPDGHNIEAVCHVYQAPKNEGMGTENHKP